MSLDLFSSVDFFFRKFSFLRIFSFFFRLSGLIVFFFLKKVFSRIKSFLSVLNKTLFQKFSRVLKKKLGRTLILLTIFYFIFIRNLTGLFPYTFGWTSHIILILQISLLLWLIIKVRNLIFNIVRYTRHFTPQGVPLGLGLFLAKIEFIRKIIRPLTLSLRLGIKITTGHVLLALIRVIGVGTNFSFRIILLATFYLFFELFVRFIQAIVYSLLLSQYFEESKKT